ncbi:RICIN domain-containing protein [Micromonospora endophytica]|uniref:Ricin B lectin domain-containing protein n=1 Tax=Micromonospora endophytica TaxID=515350 RepID=A0A2W2DNR4_9ACTN|nr:ricin-type beta-trefoil lectin domain protein [Micromonospora endophytica]PZF98786.1 hypothetical protein C1I93_07945 [Micromonospora endophytica]RIW43397.1 hypothetical protein D3H59_20790 [Micromonospora endophytica]
MSIKGTTTRRWLITRLVALCAMVAGGVLVVGSPASAYVLTGQFRNYQTGYCLDSGFPPAGSVYGPVYTLPCQAGNNWQTWEVHGPKGTSPAGYEYVQVKNRATGMCLSMDEYGGPRLYTYACNSGTGAQRLEGVGSGWNRVKLRQNWFDNRLICLDTHGINDAYARACNDGLYQVWNLIR